MVVFPNCKINIGLNILDKRADGFHNLETVFFPVPLKDAVEVIKTKAFDEEITFSQSGDEIAGLSQDNLCIKAYRLLKQDFPQLPPVQLHLHEAIPMGAGLGGGSADGAFTLNMLNIQFKLNLSGEQLMDYALRLGSDCPFFVINEPCYAAGRGEKLEPFDLDLSGWQITLVNTGIHVDTRWAFKQLTQATGSKRVSKNLHQHIHQPVGTWKEHITNDFEEVVFAAHPQLQQIKNDLYAKGAAFAAMSGSGSTIYGLFENPVAIVPSHTVSFLRQILL